MESAPIGIRFMGDKRKDRQAELAFESTYHTTFADSLGCPAFDPSRRFDASRVEDALSQAKFRRPSLGRCPCNLVTCISLPSLGAYPNTRTERAQGIEGPLRSPNIVFRRTRWILEDLSLRMAKDSIPPKASDSGDSLRSVFVGHRNIRVFEPPEGEDRDSAAVRKGGESLPTQSLGL